MGTNLGDWPRYTASSSGTIATFPLPAGLTPADTVGATETMASGVVLPPVARELRAVGLAIVEAARRLNAQREACLNPPE